MERKLILAVSAVLVLTARLTFAAAELPVERVTIYSSGVACYELLLRYAIG